MATKHVEGYLQKKSPKGVLGKHVWQRRYFVLETDQGDISTFSYYKNKATVAGNSHLGKIPVEAITSIEEVKDRKDRFNVHVEGRSFELRVENLSDLTLWVGKLKFCMDKIKEGKNAPYRRPTLLPDSPLDAMKMISTRRETIMNLDAEKTIAMMSAGTAFLKYTMDSSGRTSKDIVIVFYAQDDTKFGSLYWHEPGNRTKDPHRCLPLHTLQEVFLGKCTPELKSSAAAASDDERCFSVIGKTAQFHLEGDSRDQVAPWLFGINSIMTSKGRKVGRSGPIGEADEEPLTPSSPSSPHASVSLSQTPTTQYSSVHNNSTATAPPSSTSAGSSSTNTTASAPAPTPSHNPSVSSSASVTSASSSANTTLATSPPPEPTSALLSSPNLSTAPVGKLTIEVFLKELGSAFEPYTKTFADNGISLDFLVTLEDKDLEDLGVSRLHRKKMLFSLPELKERLAAQRQEQKSAAVAVAVAPSVVPAPTSKPDSAGFHIADKPKVETAAVDAEPENPHLKLMWKGRSFTMYESVNNTIVKSGVFVFYNPNVGKAGAFFWCPLGKREEASDHCLPLKSLTDIYLGKQTDIFKSGVAKEAPEEHCVSMIGKERTLNLEAQSIDQLKTWVAGIQYALTHSGQRVVLEEKEGQGGATGTASAHDKSGSEKPGARRISVLAKKPAADEAAAAKNAKNEANLKLMQVGCTFTLYENPSRPVARQVFVFYQPQPGTAGSFYWCDPGSRELIPDNCLPLQSLTDIFFGKQTPIFKTSFCKSVPENLCISLIGKTKQLNLEVESSKQRTAWMYGITHALTTAGRNLVLENDSKPKTGASSSGQPSATAQAAAAATSTGGAASTPGKKRFSVMNEQPSQKSKSELDPSVAHMESGHVFTSYENPDMPLRRQLFVFFNHAVGKAGTLYWCDPGKRLENPTNSLGLKSLTDIYLGKQNAIFKTELGSQATEECCISLISKMASLNLEAQSAEELKTWVTGIQTALTTSGKRVVEEKDKAAQAAAASSQSAASEAPSTPDKSSSGGGKAHRRQFSVQAAAASPKVGEDPNVAEMIKGAQFTSYINPDDPYKSEIFVWYNKQAGAAGSLCWCDPGGERVESSDRILPLKSLSDIFIGKQTPIMKHRIADRALDDCCISLISRKKINLDLEAHNADTLKTWVAGIQFALANSGKKVVLEDESKKTTPAEDNRRFSVKAQKLNSAQSPTAAANGGDEVGVPAGAKHRKTNSRFKIKKTRADAIMENENITLMTNGTVFKSYEGTVDHPTKRDLFLFYNKSVGRAGTFFWCNPGERVESTTNCLSLKSLTDIYLGKQTDMFKTAMAASAAEDACISMSGRGHKLNLEAPSAEILKAWVAGINHALTSSGKKVVEEKQEEPTPSPSAASTPATTSLAAPQGKGGPNPRRFSVLTEKQKEEPVQKSAKAHPLDFMASGHVFTSYDFARSPAREQITLWYKKSSTDAGSLYWSSSTRHEESPDRQLPLRSLTDIFLGKQTDVLRSDIAASAQQDRCFSLIGKSRALNLEAESVELLNNFVQAINDTLSLAGKEVVVDEKSDSAEARISKMRTGVVVTCYAFQGSTPIKSNVLLFYNPTIGDAGSLFWCNPNNRQESPSQSIPLRSLTDIYLGKQTDILKTAFANVAPQERCFSLIGKTQSLNMEAQSIDDLTAFVDGINYILSSSGKEVVLEKQDDIGFEELEANKEEFENAHVELMSIGANFISYRFDQLGNPIREAIFLFYNKNAGEAGSLYWCEKGRRVENPDRCLPLKALTDIYLGKQTEILRHPIADTVPQNRCISMIGRRGMQLDLEADSQDRLNAWVNAINNALTQSGKEVEELKDTPQKEVVADEDDPNDQSIAAIARRMAKARKERR